MCYVFEELKYRRYEWKCDNKNEKSKLAAKRLGFKLEGVFRLDFLNYKILYNFSINLRQHMVIKGLNRDSAYFSIIDSEWPELKKAYKKWLNPDNIDPKSGEKKQKLNYFMDVLL